MMTGQAYQYIHVREICYQYKVATIPVIYDAWICDVEMFASFRHVVVHGFLGSLHKQSTSSSRAHGVRVRVNRGV
jgi:hypothetical protein